MELWQEEWSQRITCRVELERFLELSPDERAWFDWNEQSLSAHSSDPTSAITPPGAGSSPGLASPVSSPVNSSGSDSSPVGSRLQAPLLPFAITRSWLDRMDGRLDDPLRIQAVPRIAEALIRPGESRDPLCEDAYSPLPGLVHRYEDRVLFYAGRQCGLYCRYCFRRHLTADLEAKGQPSSGKGELTFLDQAGGAAEYLGSHREVKELLLSGGDPLTLSDDTLAAVIDTFRKTRRDIVIRIGTRMPVVLPSRISSSLLSLLKRSAPLYIIVQTNHPRELSPEVLGSLENLRLSGIPLLNQSVFLRGVNDSEEVLRELSSSLLAAGVIPYYLFQGDLAAGTGHLRAPMRRGLSIMRGLRQRISGIAMPTYAVDLPDGGGKIPLPLEPPPRLRGAVISSVIRRGSGILILMRIREK